MWRLTLGDVRPGKPLKYSRLIALMSEILSARTDTHGKNGSTLCVVTVIQAVCDLCWWRGVIVFDLDVGSPSVIDNANSPEGMSGVSPSAQDDLTVECDFATSGVEEYLTAGVAEDRNGEKIVC